MAVLDRDYWLEFAREGVTKSIETREKSADRLDTFLMWVWGIYTSVFALATLLDLVSSNSWQLIWGTQPILIIMLARYACAMVSMPSVNNDESIKADPNDVASIIDSFQLIVEDKKRKLKIAKLFTLISIISISAALVGYNSCDPNKKLKQEIQTMKLKKDLDLQLTTFSAQRKTNDSIQVMNEFYEKKIQNSIKMKKWDCVEKNNYQYYDSLKLFN